MEINDLRGFFVIDSLCKTLLNLGIDDEVLWGSYEIGCHIVGLKYYLSCINDITLSEIFDTFSGRLAVFLRKYYLHG